VNFAAVVIALDESRQPECVDTDPVPRSHSGVADQGSEFRVRAASSARSLQNSRGSRGFSLAIFSSSGYFSRKGSGTFTFASFSILINCSAFTTPLP
jgi:hypothetical protein